MTLSPPIAGLGGEPPLNPPDPLYEVTDDDLERSAKRLAGMFKDHGQLVREYEYERGRGVSAAGHYGGMAARNVAEDAYHDFVNQV